MENQDRDPGTLWPFYLVAMLLMILVLVVGSIGLLYYLLAPEVFWLFFSTIFLATPSFTGKEVMK